MQIWPAWQRVLHWLLAAAIIVALITYKGGRVHEAAGYVALVAAALRVVLGVAGPVPARFATFVRGPAAVLAHAGSLARGNAERHLNHTPLGGWMIVALLAFALVGAGTGALYVTNRFWGAAWLIRAHEISTWAFAMLAPLHVLGVIHASVVHRENLVRAMVDGRKRIDDRSA